MMTIIREIVNSIKGIFYDLGVYNGGLIKEMIKKVKGG